MPKSDTHSIKKDKRFQVGLVVLAVLLTTLSALFVPKYLEQEKRATFYDALHSEIQSNRSAARQIIELDKADKETRFLPHFETKVYESGLENGYLQSLHPESKKFVELHYRAQAQIQQSLVLADRNQNDARDAIAACNARPTGCQMPKELTDLLLRTVDEGYANVFQGLEAYTEVEPIILERKSWLRYLPGV